MKTVKGKLHTRSVFLLIMSAALFSNIIVNAAGRTNYWDKEPQREGSFHYSYSWGGGSEPTHKSAVTVREYDGHNSRSYREVTFKQNADGTCEEKFHMGYDTETSEKKTKKLE